MTLHGSRFWLWIERTLPWMMLAVLATCTYAVFQEIPYAGFQWSYSDDRVFEIYVPVQSPSSLQLGDRLIQVGSTAMADFRSDSRKTLFAGVQAGQVVPLLVQRAGGQTLTVDWTFPGFNLNEALARLNSEWWLPYIFWAAGTVTLFLLRPKDARWHLLIAFNFLTALWLAAGSSLAHWHIGVSTLVLGSTVWLCVPVYLHLHWLYPQPLGRLPRWAVRSIYLAAAIPALGEWFEVLPPLAYNVGFFVAVAGSLALLGAHYLFRPTQRADLRVLLGISSLSFIPAAAVSLATALAKLPPLVAGGALLSLPALPLGYLYAAYRRQLGALELRANRLISLYLYFVFLSIVLVVLIALAEAGLGSNQAIGVLSVALPLLTLLAIGSYGRFQRMVEQYVLGVPRPPTRLVETFVVRITSSLDLATLARLLTTEVLPSLLVRQSALLRCGDQPFSVICCQGVEASQLPTGRDLPALFSHAGKYFASDLEPFPSYPWVRLILPLSVESKVIGLWILGRRDPDDFYAQAEIATLQALAQQTAIALANIEYAERLHALYQTSIDQREAERASLGRELHDHILQQVFILKANAADRDDDPAFATSYEAVTQSLYQTIRGLRPPMLEYGLYRALAALVDDWKHRPDAAQGPASVLAVPENVMRYAPHVELHLYRIVQQAGENALRHAHAHSLTIQGLLAASRVELTIEDDGLGFNAQKLLDLARPEARSHFGLIGMQERAALIGAQVQIDSAPGRGTRIRLCWSPAG